ncbi:MAG: hypothetical protein WDO13_03765 [Verrucomicrobiota bacterium]
MIVLGGASFLLHALRRWWPEEAAPDRSFRIGFFSASAMLLVLVAFLMIYLLPAFIALETDQENEEMESQFGVIGRPSSHAPSS